MLKRSGCEHRSEGALVNLHGKLAIGCPACPHPGQNLPDNWNVAVPKQ